ncbi:Tagatose-6-phosphate kinase [uncultured Clostridium sp.]|nr:Tagatose-6-phosphate kinase [uncultured Clostridium sp.]
MVLTVVLNPCVDKTLWVEKLTLDLATRAGRMDLQSGGKGTNVARVLSRLGTPCRCLALTGGIQGQWYTALAREEGIDLIPVPVSGQTRCITTMVEEGTFRQAAFAEPGAKVSEAEWRAFFEAFDAQLPETDWVVLQGSLPAPELGWVYRELIERAHASGSRVWLDSRDEGLTQCVEAGPDFIKPNEQELSQLLSSRTATGPEQLLGTVPNIVLSRGEQGASWLSSQGELRQCVFPVEAVNPVGSGDSFTAGFLHGLSRGYTREDTLKLACLLGALNASQWRAADFTRADVEGALKRYGLTLAL